jgi:hypothetical protein
MAHVRTQYWLCLFLHGLLVAIWMALVVVSTKKVDRRVTFSIGQLSLATALAPFITNLFITIIIGLPFLAFEPLAMHRAYTRPQDLAALHDCISAWTGLGGAIQAVLRTVNRRGLSTSLSIILIYFAAAWGVAKSFGSVFTFETSDQPVAVNFSRNSLTTALSKTNSSSTLWEEPGATVLLASWAYFNLDGLDRFLIPGVGRGKIFDSLSESAPPGSRTTVPAIAFDVQCGEVPQSNWTVTTIPTTSGIYVNVSATLDQYTLREQKHLVRQACD